MTFTKPRGLASGFSARQYSQAVSMQAVIDTTVLQVLHQDLFPTLGAPMDEAAASVIDAQIVWCQTHLGASGNPIKVVLRPYMGFWCKPWAKDYAGGAVRWFINDGFGNFAPTDLGGPPDSNHTIDPKTGDYKWKEYLPGTLRCWSQNGMGLAADFYSQCAARWGASVLEVDCGGALMTQYGEPLITQQAVQENVDAQFLAGWTEETRQNALVSIWTSAYTAWGQTWGVGCFTSYNPGVSYQSGQPTASGWKTVGYDNTDLTFTLQNAQDAVLGPFSLLGNESFDAHWLTGDPATDSETRMWNRMHTGTSQTPIQTTTLAKHISAGILVKNTVEAAIQFGATRLELPVGCDAVGRGTDQITPAYAVLKSPLITYDTRKDVTVAPTAALIGTISAGLVGPTQLATISAVLPAGIPDGSVLDLIVGASTNLTLVSITGVAGVQTPLGANPDVNGTNLPCWHRSIVVGAADSGATITVTVSAVGRLAMVGAVISNVMNPTSAAVIATGSSITMPTVTDQASFTLEYAATRVAVGSAPVITLPGTYIVDASAATVFAATATNISLALGVDAGVGGGVGTAAGPAADKMTGWTVSYAQALPTAGTGSGTTTRVGAATGTAPVGGLAASALLLLGVASGATPMSGVAVGTTSSVGTSAGVRTSSAQALGSTSYAGAASGSRNMTGAGAGPTAWAGLSSGARLSVGAAASALALAGAASGTAPAMASAQGVGVGMTGWAGGAAGALSAVGTSAGVVSLAGTSSGAILTSGAAAGTTTGTGAATGARQSSGGATGVLALLGTASGTAPAMVSAQGGCVGTTALVGLAAGTIVVGGAGTPGSVGWAGSGTGALDARGASAGTTTEVGAGSGSRATSGVGSGTVALMGSASGAAAAVPVAAGAGTGTWALVAAAAGARTCVGAGLGTSGWVGSSSGSVLSSGVGTGAVGRSGLASGSTTLSGSAVPSSLALVGLATGSRATSGTGAGGPTAWLGSAVGGVQTQGDAVGGVRWAGLTSGVTLPEGSAWGTTTWSGDASSRSSAPPVEIEASLPKSTTRGRLVPQLPPLDPRRPRVNIYQRETDEFVEVDVTLDGAHWVDNVEFAVVPAGMRPLLWTSAVVQGGATGLRLRATPPGTYQVFARVSEAPYLPEVACGWLKVV